MPYALLLWLWISVISVFLNLMSGLHFFRTEHFLRLHVIMALGSITLALFAHTMTMFYFIGIGKKIKEFVATWDPKIQEDLRTKIIALKRKIFPAMTFACMALMLAFILGGAFDARLVSRPVHAWTAFGAFVYHAHVVVRETFSIFKHIDLIDEVNHLARARADSAQASAS